MKRFIYIDDEADVAESFAEALMEASGSSLSIEVKSPTSLAQAVELLSTNPEGLLLDIKLSNTKDKEGNPLRFDGLGLAQQLRSLQTRGVIKPLPFVRFSQPEVVREFVRGDSTSDDCFDDRVSKDDIAGRAAGIAARLASLAAGYPRIVNYLSGAKDAPAVASLLGCSVEFLDRIDRRIIADIDQASDAPAHVLAGFFLDKLLDRPGPLIGEGLLAARLGVDRGRSEATWPSILRNVDGARYQGAFHDGYPRWWMALLSDIWESLPGVSASLARTRADERAAFLQKAWGGEIHAISETKDSPGRRYWALCVATKVPVDPSFGIALLPRIGHQPWQDADYLSLEAGLRDSHNSRIRPDEKARLQRELTKRGKN
jgi:hypothetical protein